jgi:RsiW-degrading membrane proteinase PrsW (M82 family)
MQAKLFLAAGTAAMLFLASYAVGYGLRQVSQYGPVIPASLFCIAWYFYLDKTKSDQKSSRTVFIEFLVGTLIGAFLAASFGLA